MLDKHLCDLLEARGLDIELCANLGFRGDPERGQDWLVIPFLELGTEVNHKYRTLAGQKRFSQDEGGKKLFWNFDCLLDGTLDSLPLIITEGELDAVPAIQAGFLRTISVPDGAPATQVTNEDSRKYTYLADAKKLLDPVREIILAVDGDGPGHNLLNDLAIRLGKARCKWVRYPKCRTPDLHRDKGPGDTLKDLGEVLLEYGVKGVVETINRAQWMRVDGVYRMSELPPMPVIQGHPTHIPGLDKHLRLRTGDFSVVTGIPSHGKSSLVNEIAHRMARHHGWRTSFASFEQKPQIDHRRALRTLHSGYRVVDCTQEMLAAADAWIDEYYSFIVPSEDDEATLDWFLERAAAAVVQHGAKLVIADPWNEMDHIRPPDMSLTEYTGFAIKQFKKFAAKYDAHMMVVAHPAKMKREDGKTPVPTLYDISDSAHWFNKPDLGVIVHRIDEEDTLIRVQKSRYHDQIGEPGDVHLTFNKFNGRYSLFQRGEAA